jgi:ribosomal protein S18 acetylase RimI-like enzyme
LLPDFWDKGYGKKLFQETLEKLMTRGFTELVLWVLDTNTRGQRFYQARGLTLDGQKKSETWQNGVMLNELRYRGKLRIA